MPFRASLPKLSIKFSSSSSKSSTTPSIFSPPSANSTPTSSKTSTPQPMTPPARLHLRNVLPTSPDYLPTPPPPPPQPRPWVWQCHSCLTIWRLASTRRCLVCSHDYCTAAAKPPTTGGRRGSGGGGARRRRRNGPGSGGAFCRAEFDYTGWEEWGEWRRKVLGLEARATPRARDRAFLRRTHDCWLDCDYPSQCHHERAQIAARGAMEASRNSSAYYRLRAVAEEEPESPVSPPIVKVVSSSERPSLTVTNPDDDLQMNEALDIADEKDQEQEKKSPTSPKSPLSQTSFFPDADDEVEKKKEETTTDTAANAKTGQKKSWWKPVDEYKAQVTRDPPTRSSKGTKSGGMLKRFMRQDQSLMPLEYSNYDNMKASGGGGKLTVRNSVEPEVVEYSSPSSSSSDDEDSMSDDSDDNYEMAETDLSSVEDTRTLEEIENDLRLLIESTKSLRRG